MNQPGLRDRHACRRGRINASIHRRIDGVAMTVAAEATPDRAQRTGYNLPARHVPSAWPGHCWRVGSLASGAPVRR
ncbi:hypothetical protein ACFS07_29645 [Undibacterium arcticum]